jgi:hypothetical protein
LRDVSLHVRSRRTSDGYLLMQESGEDKDAESTGEDVSVALRRWLYTFHRNTARNEYGTNSEALCFLVRLMKHGRDLTCPRRKERLDRN